MSSSVKSTTMCACDQNNDTEEYHTARSDFETSTPEEWRTSTQYYDEDSTPEYRATPRRIVRRGFQRSGPRGSLRIPRRLDLTAGVAIVPRRIDFDAVSEVEDFDNEEEEPARETLERLRTPEQHPTFRSHSETYRLGRTRRPQFPEYRRQYLPRMTRITPCGKCLRI